MCRYSEAKDRYKVLNRKSNKIFGVWGSGNTSNQPSQHVSMQANTNHLNGKSVYFNTQSQGHVELQQFLKNLNVEMVSEKKKTRIDPTNNIQSSVRNQSKSRTNSKRFISKGILLFCILK